MAAVTITTTAPQDARLAPAFGAKLNLPGSATTAQVKAYLIQHMTDVVLGYEEQLAINAAKAATTPFTPT